MSINPQLNTVLFDLDGTLVDNFVALHRSYIFAYQQIGLDPPSFEAIKRAVGGSSPVTMRRLLGDERAVQALPHFEKHFNEIMLEGVFLLPGAEDLLKRLKDRDWRLAVFTNKYAAASRTICDHLGISVWLDAIIGTGECPWRKPEEAFTRHALDVLKASPQQAIMIGDSPFDMQSAAVVGMPAYAVATGTHSQEELRQANSAPSEVFSDLIVLSHELFGISLKTA